MSIKKYVLAAFLGLGICAGNADASSHSGIRLPKRTVVRKTSKEKVKKQYGQEKTHKRTQQPNIGKDNLERNAKELRDKFVARLTQTYASDKWYANDKELTVIDAYTSNINNKCVKVIRNYIKDNRVRFGGPVYGNVIAFHCKVTDCNQADGLKDAIIVIKNGNDISDPDIIKDNDTRIMD